MWNLTKQQLLDLYYRWVKDDDIELNDDLFTTLDRLESEDTLLMCPHCCGTNNELKNGEWYCKDCSCLHKYLKPRK